MHFFLNVEIFSSGIRIFVCEQKSSCALFGNLESSTLVQFLVTLVVIFFFCEILGSLQGCTNFLELLQPELFAKNTQGETVPSVKMSACLLECAIPECYILLSPIQSAVNNYLVSRKMTKLKVKM
jgi:hypothetical protein